MYVFGRDLSISIDTEIDIYDIRPCICQGKAPAICQSFQSFFDFTGLKMKGFSFTLLSGKLFSLFFLSLCF